MRKDTTFNPDLTGVQNETRREQEAKKSSNSHSVGEFLISLKMGAPV